MPKFDELGVSGLKEYSGYVEEAYSRELRWPTVSPLYSRMRRSDPEISVVRNVFTALASSQSFRWELPEDPTDGDKAAQEFAETLFDDMEGGEGGFLETLTSNVPFLGWGWWEMLPGYRNPSWQPPNGDPWRSSYSDNRIGVRRLAWRDTSSFYKWEFAKNGQMTGMWQWAMPDPQILLPLDRSLHLTFGDAHNPEGLSPLEAVWRLERIKYGLEVVQGIGFEHAAGYLSVTADNALGPEDKAAIRAAARSIMSAQEGNYAAWPKGVTGELVDVPFAAAPSILEAIKYFGILKLMVFNMQWVALSATTGSGSYSAMQDSSSMFITTYNAMMEGFTRQINDQLGKRVFSWNDFPGMTRRPQLKIDPVNKLSLDQLATILGPLQAAMQFGDDDIIAIRKQTGFLPETLPDISSENEPETASVDETPATEDEPESAAVQNDTEDAAEDTAQTVMQSLIKWRQWAAKSDRKAFAEMERKA